MGDVWSDLGMNERAWLAADACVHRAAELRIAVHTLGSGARVIDAGIEAPGGFARGARCWPSCAWAASATSSFAPLTFGGESWAGVQVWTDHPAESCMASQYAGLGDQPGGLLRDGLRTAAREGAGREELFGKLGYAEDAARGVLVLETRTLPTDDVAAWVARKAGVPPAALTFAVAPTASLAGGVQIVARVIETGLHKMDTLGFDVRGSSARSARRRCRRRRRATCARSAAPTTACSTAVRLATPSARKTTSSRQLAERLPSSASPDYGTPFYDIFKRYDNDFYKIDPMLFSPAEVWLTSAASGRTFHAGAAQSRRAACVAVRVVGPYPSDPSDARRHPQCAHRLAHRRTVSRARRAGTRSRVLPYEGLVARLGASARLHLAVVPPQAGLSSGGTDLLDADAVLARIIPSGSLEQIIFRVDALHWIEERGVPVMNSPRAIERSRRQVLHHGAAAGSGPAGAGDGGLRGRDEAMAAVQVDGRRHHQADLRLDGARPGPRQRSRRRLPRGPGARADAGRVLRAARRRPRRARRARVRRRRRACVGAIERLAPRRRVADQRVARGPARPRRAAGEWAAACAAGGGGHRRRLRRRRSAAVASTGRCSCSRSTAFRAGRGCSRPRASTSPARSSSI